jgi:hypothetical protein
VSAVAAESGIVVPVPAAVGRFPGGVLYLEPTPASYFVSLTERPFAAWPQCPPYGGQYDASSRT